MNRRTKCQCDISGAPKQWCQRHQCYKSPIQVRQCQLSIPNFEAWDNCQGVGQDPSTCHPVPIDKDDGDPPASLGITQSYTNNKQPKQTGEEEGCSSCQQKKQRMMDTQDKSSLDTKEESYNSPNVMKMGWNFAKAVGAYVKSGMRNTSEEEFAERMSICDTCEWRSGSRCMKCGCFVDKKAGWASSDCPIGKWPKTNL